MKTYLFILIILICFSGCSKNEKQSEESQAGRSASLIIPLDDFIHPVNFNYRNEPIQLTVNVSPKALIILKNNSSTAFTITASMLYWISPSGMEKQATTKKPFVYDPLFRKPSAVADDEVIYYDHITIPPGVIAWFYIDPIPTGVDVGIKDANGQLLFVLGFKDYKKFSHDDLPTDEVPSTIKIADSVITEIVLSSNRNETSKSINPPTSDNGMETVDIEGNWDNDKAIRIAIKLLQEYDWEKLGVTKPLENVAIREFKLAYSTKDGILLSLSTITEGEGYHAAAPYLSFFEFEKKTNGWKLVVSAIGVVKSGSWGIFSPQSLTLRALGEDKYGIFLTDGFYGQGSGGTQVSIYYLFGNSYKELLSVPTSQSNAENKSWNTKIIMSPSVTNGFYDLEFSRTGDLRLLLGDGSDKEPDIANRNGTVRARDIFKFDGNTYKRVTQ